MLTEIYPRVHRRYSSLPVLGHILGDYAGWLKAHGYPVHRIQAHFRAARRLDAALRHRGVRAITDLSRARLDRCAPSDSQEDVELAAVVTALERYLTEKGVFAPHEPTAVERCAAAYGEYVRDVRGFAAITEKQHIATATRFLTSISYESNPRSLKRLRPSHVEAFVRRTGASWGRAGLQHVVGQLRGFLRFLAANGLAPTGLDAQIDTPRVYRGELLPRSLPWETVRAFLCSIDRSRPPGKRDYAMFLIMATYGLRSIDIVTLTLDDIDWRAATLRVTQRKTGAPLMLPLTDEVASRLIAYLRVRPSVTCREVFVRCRAPEGPLKHTGPIEAFQAWSRRCKLEIPFQGPHCLRHSLAVHLLRQGTPLKTIGDVLGHRTAESTCVYLRLAVEDLRDVALSLPRSSKPNRQVRS